MVLRSVSSALKLKDAVRGICRDVDVHVQLQANRRRGRVAEKKKACSLFELAAPQGVEPRYDAPEAPVLPLNEGAAIVTAHKGRVSSYPAGAGISTANSYIIMALAGGGQTVHKLPRAGPQEGTKVTCAIRPGIRLCRGWGRAGGYN